MITTDVAQILPRRGTAAAFTAADTLLGVGERGFETDTNLSKVGDGVTLWNALGYEFPQLAAEIHLATAKTTPVDADLIPLSDSAAGWILKNFSWAAMKATLKSYFDSLYTSILSYTTTATAGGTTVLTAASTFWQFFTGTLNQAITLPVTSTLGLGQPFTEITNNSTGILTVNSSGGNLVLSMPAGTVAIFECILTTGTTAASWNADFIGASTLTGTGAAVLNTSPSITDPKITRTINAQAGTAYTFVLTDVGKEVTTSNAAPVAASIPTDASVPYPIGSTIYGKNIGAGLLTIAAVTPGTTTVRSQGTTTAAPTIAQYGSWKATKTAANTWDVTGDVVKTGSSSAVVNIYSTTLGSPQASIVATIPTGYKNLRIEYQARTTYAAVDDQFQMRINADTGSNYDSELLEGDNTTPQASNAIASDKLYIGYLSGASATANTAGSGVIFIPNYLGTVFNKALNWITGAVRANTAASSRIRNGFGQWRSTSAITSLTFYSPNGNLDTGTHIDIYGVN